MKKITATVLLSSGLLSVSSVALLQQQLKLVTTTYIASEENFANPERGFMPSFVVGWKLSQTGEDLATWDFCGSGNNFTAYNDDRLNVPLRQEEMQAMRNSGQSLARVIYHLSKYRNAELDAAALQLMQQDFATARAGGIKLSPAFTYNFSKGGPDAPLTRVLQHIQAIKPILQKNADVIAQVHLSWIGCWGEMHTSSNKLIDDGRFNDKTRQIMTAMLDAVPAERFIMVRYPFIKFAFLSQQQTQPIAPVSSQEAFNASAKSRLGHQEDCIDCGEFNGGTWSIGGTPSQLRSYLEAESRFVPQFAESDTLLDAYAVATDADGDGFTRPEHDSCFRMIGTKAQPGLLVRQHFSGIDSDNPIGLEQAKNIGIASSQGIQRWKRDGCYLEIAKRLGYRLVLQRSIIPSIARIGQQLPMSIDIRNVGYASPYNPRGLELVLRAKTNGQVTRLSFLKAKDANLDPRFWLPERGEISLKATVVLPKTLATGMYEVLLNLPDPKPSLESRAEYSIRLANQNIWEATTGFNALKTTLEILP